MTKTIPFNRENWLTLTLFSLGSYFRDETPPIPADLTAFPSGKYGAVASCADGRVVHTELLHLEAGDYYTLKPLGVAYPIYEKADNSIRAQIQRALRPIQGDAHPRLLALMGHEGCGANRTLTDALLSSWKEARLEAEARLMIDIVPDDFKMRFPHGHFDEKTKSTIHSDMIPAMTLLSASHIHGYKLRDNMTVESQIAKGDAHIVCAVEGLKQEDGKFPLRVYDPQNDAFVSIQTLYDEAFPGNNQRTFDAILQRYNQFMADRTRGASNFPYGSAPVIMRKGAHSETVQSFELGRLTKAVRERFEAMAHVAQEAKR